MKPFLSRVLFLGMTPRAQLEELPARRWRLLTTLEYEFVAEHRFYGEMRARVYVPAGAVTDFASVPRVLWSVIPPYGRYTRAAILHDWQYSGGKITFRVLNGDAPNTDLDMLPDRESADLVFLAAMRFLSVGSLRRRTMYAGVRLGGWRGWQGGGLAVRKEEL